ncbi:DUF58 domain-containing protein [Alteromonas pelagimontana]|uniref:DUF58 domain-containing protein n=1 Tax=Alteromonas pelagimontana TaxID=1858656 RepID=A0A6M4M9S8_9ALTE|nr:DUF58 domain-containing protein [Alteromonas pelagimontana]QJR79867.1 DUF58 domain-containing protein [Alteromonas pelagimontana]
MTKNTTSQWLNELHTNGVELSVQELLRYQQLTSLVNLAPKSAPQAQLSGAYLAKQKGRGMEFDEARHYQAGDDIRAIDWRVTARTGKTHTKIYREERERPVFILCDLTASMQFGTQLLLKAVQAAHLTSLISWSAAKRGDKVGALVFNDQLHRECKPLSRKPAVLAICHELLAVQKASNVGITPNIEGFADACARVRRVARPGSLVYLISDFNHVSYAATQHINHLSRHCEVQAMVVNDPLEQALPDVPLVQPVDVTDGQQRQTWLLGDQAQQHAYQQWRVKHTESVEQIFRQAKVKHQFISAGMPLDEQLGTRMGRKR